MDLLDIGLILFVGTHSVPFFPGLRNALVGKFGEKGYKLGFSLVSLAALILVGFGYGSAAFEPLWTFPAYWKQVSVYTLPLFFIFFMASGLKGHIRKVLRHPLSVGVILWGGLHILATGHLAAVKLFGALVLYALADIITSEARGRVSDHQPETRDDLKAIAAGLIAYGVFYFAHGWLFGVPLGG